MKKKRLIVYFLLIIACMRSLVVQASIGTVDIWVEGKGVLAQVYQIGTKNKDGSIVLKEEYGIVNALSNAKELKAATKRLDKILGDKADISKVSNEQGKISISGLKDGLYYIRFSGGEYMRKYVSTLIQIPDYYQKIYPKYEELSDTKPVEIIETGDEKNRNIYLKVCAASLVMFVIGTRKFMKTLGGKNE